MIDGFYEWKQEGRKKIPRYCSLGGGRPMLIAALCARLEIPDAYRRAWNEEGGGALKPLPRDLRTFTMVTRSAVGEMRSLHHRQPLVLTEETARLWLDDGCGVGEGVFSSGSASSSSSSSSSSLSSSVASARAGDGSVESIVAAAAKLARGGTEAASGRGGGGGGGGGGRRRTATEEGGASSTSSSAITITTATPLVQALSAALNALDAKPNPLPIKWHIVSEEVNKTKCQSKSCSTPIEKRRGTLHSFFGKQASGGGGGGGGGGGKGNKRAASQMTRPRPEKKKRAGKRGPLDSFFKARA